MSPQSFMLEVKLLEGDCILGVKYSMMLGGGKQVAGHRCSLIISRFHFFLSLPSLSAMPFCLEDSQISSEYTTIMSPNYSLLF